MRQFHPEIEIQTKSVKEKKVKVALVKSKLKCSECDKTFRIEKTFNQHKARFHPDMDICTDQLNENEDHKSPLYAKDEDFEPENTNDQSEQEATDSNYNDE